MLAETIREWEERNYRRGYEEGLRLAREEKREEGREGNRRLLCHMAALRFGDATADAIRPLLSAMQDRSQFTAVGMLIIDSTTAAELVDGTRRLAKENNGQRV